MLIDQSYPQPPEITGLRLARAGGSTKEIRVPNQGEGDRANTTSVESESHWRFPSQGRTGPDLHLEMSILAAEWRRDRRTERRWGEALGPRVMSRVQGRGTMAWLGRLPLGAEMDEKEARRQS